MLSFKLVAKVAFLASLASLSSSSPLAYERKDTVAVEIKVESSEVKIDVSILNFALTLEHLEHQFYLESLHRFGEQDFRRANVPNPTQAFQNFHHILQHEAQHVKTLQTVIKSLGGTPLPPCKYKFGVEDVHGFMALARILEKVGVSAYDGAVALLNNPDLQTAAATIDTVEARHASFIATVTGVDPFAEDFDVALSGNQVVTLAAAVIKECPFDIKSMLGAAPAGTLSLVAPHVVRAGREIKVKFDPGHNKPEDHFCGFLFSDKSVVSPVTSDFKCRVPRGSRGDIFVAVLNKNEKLSSKNSIDIIVAGPMILTIDTTIEDSCKKFVHGVDFEWKGYGIREDKAYDVDVDWMKDYTSKDDYKSKGHKSKGRKSKGHKSKGHKSKGHKSNDYKWNHNSNDYTPEHDSNDTKLKDHKSKDNKSKDHESKDNKSKDQSQHESKSTHNSTVDASTDYPAADTSKDNSTVVSSTSIVASTNQTDVKVDSASPSRKRGLIWSASGHAELPLSGASPVVADAPIDMENADEKDKQDHGDDGMESDGAGYHQTETDDMESTDMPQDDMNDNSDMEMDHDNSYTESIDTEQDDMNDTSDMGMDYDNSYTEGIDTAHDDMNDNSDMGMDHDYNDMKMEETNNDDMENNDMKNDDAHYAKKNGDDKSASDHDNSYTEGIDTAHDDMNDNSDMGMDHDNSDMKMDETNNDDLEYSDKKNDDGHNAKKNGDDESASDVQDFKSTTTGSPSPVDGNLPTVVAVYPEDKKVAPPPAQPPVSAAPKEANNASAAPPAQPPVSAAPKEANNATAPPPAEPTVPGTANIAPTPLPAQPTVPAAEAKVPAAPANDDVIEELRKEVALAVAGQDPNSVDTKAQGGKAVGNGKESVDTKEPADDVLDELDVEEPESEDDGTEVEASDSDPE